MQPHMKYGFCVISEEIFDISSSSMVHRSTHSKSMSKFELVDLACISQRSFNTMAYEGWFPSISEEIFDVSSSNLVHRSTRARWKPGSNWVTFTLFSRSQRSFKATAYGRWLPFNISHFLINLVHRSTRTWQRPSLNLMTLTIFSRSWGSFQVI